MFTQLADGDGWTRRQTSPVSAQTFAYDPAGGLVQTQDTVTGAGVASCTTRAYTLDKDSNRTALAVYPDDGTDPDDGHCTTATTPTVSAATFDAADRITASGSTYDTLDRTRTVPGDDATGIGSHASLTGSLTVGYHVNDMPATQTQGGATVSYTLYPAGNRILASTDSTTGQTTTNHYTSGSDSPAWSSTTTGWTRYLTRPTGDTIGAIDQTGQVILYLANMHGDVVAKVADDTAAVGTTWYGGSTEYGTPRDPATAPDAYGWLGAKQRSSNALGGLIIVGVRLYNPATGRFLFVDPILGGNANPYVYVLNLTNPITKSGPNGQWWRWLRPAVHLAIGIAAGAIAGVVAVGVCGAIAGVGRLVVAGVITKVAVGAVAHPVADRILGHRTTAHDIASYAIKDALTGGFAGGFKGSYGYSPLIAGTRALTGRSHINLGFGGFKVTKARPWWLHR